MDTHQFIQRDETCWEIEAYGAMRVPAMECNPLFDVTLIADTVASCRCMSTGILPPHTPCLGHLKVALHF